MDLASVVAVLKFYFVRVCEPWMSTTGPSWDHKGDELWRPVDGADQDDDSAEATWRWLLGKSPVEPAPLKVCGAPPMTLLQEDNEAPTEQERVTAIFACAAAAAADQSVAEELVRMLASTSTKATVDDILLEAFNHSTNEFRGRKRQSKACNPSGTNPADLDLMHALAAAGAPVLPVLLKALRSEESWWVRAAMASAIGSLGCGTDAAIDALAQAVSTDDNVWVRRNAAEALGYTLGPTAHCTSAKAAAIALTAALHEVDDVEEFNYEQSYPYIETLRQAAATALARSMAHPVVASAAGVPEALLSVCKREVAHKLNVTTRWSAAVALERSGSKIAFAEGLRALGWFE